MVDSVQSPSSGKLMEDPAKGTGSFPRKNIPISSGAISTLLGKKTIKGGFRRDTHILDNISEEWSPLTNVTDTRTC